MNARQLLALAALSALAAPCALGCGNEELPYQPRPALTGRTPDLPAVPTLPTKARKAGDAYTVWGAVHDLRSRVKAEEVTTKKISLVGYIVKTNYADAPACAVHATGKADPPDCKAPVPSFAIADDKGETKEMIDVMGWASNFAQIYTLLEALGRAPAGKSGDVKLQDEFWQVDLPNPLPNLGAKVKVTGSYSTLFNKGTAAANPKFGILTVDKIEYLEPPTDRPVLPGMKTK